MKNININCDVGEGVNNEAKLMPYIQSCNIACGGHAGDQNTMKKVVELAIKFKVNIGAHPSYPDRRNFGRKSMQMEDQEFISEMRIQIKRLEEVIEKCKGKLNHIKPHGALYNDIAKSKSLTKLFLNAIQAYKQKKIELFLPFGSLGSEVAKKQGFIVIDEVFADRNYNEDYGLVSRTQNNAVIESSQAVLEHMNQIVLENHVRTVNRKLIPIVGATFCVHSDTSSAVQIVELLHKVFNS